MRGHAERSHLPSFASWSRRPVHHPALNLHGSLHPIPYLLRISIMGAQIYQSLLARARFMPET
jgi:hypothetical protein